MSVKLITSDAYISSMRCSFAEKPDSKSSPSEKSSKIFNKILDSSNFIFNKDVNSEKFKWLTNDIKTIVSIRPGRVLFKRLLKADKPLEIVFDSKEYPNCSYNGKTVVITLNDSTVYYFISANSNGEKFFSSAPSFIIFAHELVHALHYFEEGLMRVKEKKKSVELLDPEFDDLEEEETIRGKEGQESFCDNGFRAHFGYPLRINHRSLGLEGEKPFTISECACVGALADLKEGLSSNPSLINLPQPIRSCNWWEKRGGLPRERQGAKLPEVTPLNISLFKDQTEISDYLFQSGVDVNAQDEHWGSALHVAVKKGRLDWVQMLLDKGADANTKDSNGLIPLRLAFKMTSHEMQSMGFEDEELLLAQEEAIELLAPLSNLKEGDILHHAMHIGSLDGFRALIRHGADINCKDSEGNTPLMCSIFLKNEDHQTATKFQVLLENDQLDLNAKNANGETALSLAIKEGNLQKMVALLNKGAKVPREMKEQVRELLESHK